MTNSSASLKSNSPSPSRNNSSTSAGSIKSGNSNTTMTSATSPQGLPTQESPKIILNDDTSGNVFASPSQPNSNTSSSASPASSSPLNANYNPAQQQQQQQQQQQPPPQQQPGVGGPAPSFNLTQPITPTPTSPINYQHQYEGKATHSQHGAGPHYSQLNPNISTPGKEIDIDLIVTPKRHSSSRFEPTSSERYQEIVKLPNFDEVLPEEQIQLFIQKSTNVTLCLISVILLLISEVKKLKE